MNNSSANIDPREVAKFDEAAARWWDPNSEFKPLHDINPLRLNFIDSCTNLNGKQVLDVGCGGGILAEGMASRGAQLTAIDMAEATLKVARLHLLESGHEIDYLQTTVEEMAEQHPQKFDIVTCMELLEHVPKPASVIASCARLVKSDGHVFFSTLNRNLKSYLLAVLGAEYLLQMLPKGTHDYARFIQPAELDAWMRQCGLSMQKMAGITYNPLSRKYRVSDDVSVNYLVHAINNNA